MNYKILLKILILIQKTTQLAMDKVDQINRLMNKHHVSTIGELLQIKLI